MNLLVQLSQMAGSSRPWAAQRAQTALNTQAAVRQGKMTISEGKEILQDLINTDTLDMEADDLEIKTQLVNIITNVLSFVGSMTSFPGVKL